VEEIYGHFLYSTSRDTHTILIQVIELVPHTADVNKKTHFQEHRWTTATVLFASIY